MPKIVSIYSNQPVKPKSPNTVFMKLQLHVVPGRKGELHGRSCFFGDKKATLEEAANIKGFSDYASYLILEVDLDQ